MTPSGRPVVFTARATVPGRVQDVFDALTDWPRQTAWVPATVVARDESGPVAAVGERFAGTTTLGPWVLVDTMTVVARTEPGPGPGRVELVKTGDVLGGGAEIVVREAGPGLVAVEWTESIEVRSPLLAALARLAGPLPALVGRLAFGDVLRRARDELTR